MENDLRIDAGCLPAAGIVVVFIRLLAARNLDFVDTPASRQSKRACSALDFRSSVNLVDYFRLRRDFRVRGWENLVDFLKGIAAGRDGFYLFILLLREIL